MPASALVTLREGLEAVLLIGILLSYLNKIGRVDQYAEVWKGVGAAIGVSVVLAVILQLLGAGLEGQVEEL